MSLATSIVAPRMQSLQKLQKSLKRLDLSWKVIETTARVVSPPESTGFIATLEHTRSAFSRLASEMVEQIAQTHIVNCQRDLASQAQVAIDILVRNLFERTADVGFIATDGPLVDYVLAPEATDPSEMRARLAQYRNKYTVYDDILVLDKFAQPLVSLQPRRATTVHAPAWWARTMSNSGYVEVFGSSGFFNGAGDVLLYANSIVAPSGDVCGAVVLKFDLQSELHSIFKALHRDNAVILLVDDRARVVASSDVTQGFKSGESIDLPTTPSDQPPTCTILGIKYLFAHCTTRGYQGYAGPGWTALALVPLDAAFSTSAALESGAPRASEIEIELDNPQLQDIIARARAIEKDLNRVIWNGKLQDSGSRSASALGPVFAEIGRTSFLTISAFDGAILELKQLLMAGRRTELASHAALAVDIMDRNLYERANDCRWWALSEEFAEILDTLEREPSALASQRAAEILAHLNSLYTVYQRVALFDRQGRIVAVSKDAQTLSPAAVIPPALLQGTLSLRGTQAYTVSGMEPHALADGDATYLYCAPIYNAGQTVALGGIALAFNCRAELQAMLQDSLPVGAATLGFFMAEDGKVLASTDGAVAVGDIPEFAAKLGQSENNSGIEPLLQWNGRTYLAGLAQSKGYREFKVSDGYRDPVRSVLLTAVEPSPAPPQGHTLPRPSIHRNAATQQYGIVQCGRMLFALSSAHVVEAVSTTDLTAPAAASDSLGLMKYTSAGQLAVLPAYDSCKLTGQDPISDVSKAVAIILRGAHQNIALLVDRLVDVIECNALEPPPGGISADSPWINGFIHDNQVDSEPVFALDPAGL